MTMAFLHRSFLYLETDDFIAGEFNCLKHTVKALSISLTSESVLYSINAKLFLLFSLSRILSL